ncbi:hypothetical protein SAMN02982929_01044 [Saccharopolyspora kobensis]|uniref:ATP synthase protein I n=1 Tax=Saccharopolyspora kobensis TaxID=146035 RepID=A0A1H5W0E2_9PSEU|nr:hypothetical protein [Saccharopolyspora kobensis]SEF92883.1 hypothetical protein SAMN02982929_01044 [Saccharopolyspora kobensis]SFD71139.1 hypothetical protein SAMN05216506_10616 [Saccharopolyspora kobensis]
MITTKQVLAPGLVIGVVGALFADGLAVLSGVPAGWAVVTAVALGVPLAAFGAGCSALRARGVLRGGAFAPVALYWLLAFPLARLVQEVVTGLVLAGRLVLPPQLAAFLVYQALISVGFAIGFVWVQERMWRSG